MRAMTEPTHSDGTSMNSLSIGLALLAVYGAEDDLRSAHAELVSLAAHRFDEDAEMHLSSAAHLEGVGTFRLIDAQGHVFQQLAEEPVAQLARCDELALLAREGAVIDGEVHLDGRLAYLHEGHGIYLDGTQSVLPMVMFSMPLKHTMSPTCASSTETRLSPSIWKSVTTLLL